MFSEVPEQHSRKPWLEQYLIPATFQQMGIHCNAGAIGTSGVSLQEEISQYK